MDEVATLAGGCFWCLEAVFDQLKGVEVGRVGLHGRARPRTPPTSEVCSGARGHAEVVRVTFDPAELSYRDLLVGLLHHPRPDHAQPPGQRRRHAVPLGDLLPLAGAEARRRGGDRAAHGGASSSARPDRDRGRPRPRSSTWPRTTTRSTSQRVGGAQPVLQLRDRAQGGQVPQALRRPAQALVGKFSRRRTPR